MLFAAVQALDVQGPARGLAAPVGTLHFVPVADVLVDAIFAGCFTQVIEDQICVGNRLGAEPRLEFVAEGIEVRVGADAGVAEQIPGPAAGLARLQNGIALTRQIALQVVGSADARQAGTDDQDIDMLDGRLLMDAQRRLPEVDG